MKAGGKDSQLFIISDAVFEASDQREIEATVAGLKECGLYALPYEVVSIRSPLDRWGTITLMDGVKPRPDPDGRERLIPTTEPNKYNFAYGPHHYIECRGVSLDPNRRIEVWVVHDGSDPTYKPYELQNLWVGTKKEDGSQIGRAQVSPLSEDGPDELELLRRSACDFLIALLATSNAAKEVTHNKRVRLGIGAGKLGSTGKYEYVTRIDVPPAYMPMEDDEAHPPTGRTVCPHLRRGHPKRVRYGAGRQLVRVQWIAPCFVNADRDWVRSRKAYALTHTTH